MICITKTHLSAENLKEAGILMNFKSTLEEGKSNTCLCTLYVKNILIELLKKINPYL